MDSINTTENKPQNRVATKEPNKESFPPLKKNSDDDLNQVKNRMTTRFTQFIAAQYIADPHFPDIGHLPSLKPFPFTTFGHQPRLDYRKLQYALWGVITQIRSITKNWARFSPLLTGAIFVATILIWVGIENNTRAKEIEALVIAAIFLGGSLAGKYFFGRSVLKKVANVRARALERLLQGKWDESVPINNSKLIDATVKFVGSGNIDGSALPVVTIKSASQPFPGFGRLQSEESYLCRPNTNSIAKPDVASELADNILIHVKTQLSASGIKNITFGKIVVIHASTLRLDSPWLDREKRPRLFVEQTRIETYKKEDSAASVREYFVIEVLFEEFMTTAYFFFRPFLAGNAAACHLAVCTLGPPVTTIDHLEKVLMQYKLSKSNKNTPQLNRDTLQNEKPEIRDINLIRSILFDKKEFQSRLDYKSIKDNTIKNLYHLNYKQQNEFEKNYNGIVAENNFWPGMSIINSPNTREENSLTFTTDFFGRTESIASVKALYDQISRAILDAIKENGFDVSDYSDNEGNYTIKADKIDNLVVGEHIYIKKEGESSPKKQDKKQAEEINA